MKKTFATLGMSVCVLALFSSCQSTDGDGYDGEWEEATPMSEMSVADGEIPPWLLEDDGSEQVDAGDYTPDTRNQYAIPDPEETVADSGASGSTDQNQPAMAAAATAEDDVTVETPEIPAEVNVVDPLMQPGTPVIAATPAEQVTRTEARTTIIKKAPASTPAPVRVAVAKPKEVAPAKKSSTTKIAAAKKPTKKADIKKPAKPKEPTLVTYKVRPGDSLSDIAQRSNTTVAQIKKDSKLGKSDVIHPGQVIKVRYYPKGYKPGANPIKAKSHTVARGESISAIAKRNGVTVQDILKANNIAAKDAAKIRPGKRLTIPAKGSAAATTGKKGTKAAATTTGAKAKKHTVARGESLSTIAARNGVTVSDLLKANNLSKKDADMIRAGQTLTIPANTSTKKKR